MNGQLLFDDAAGLERADLPAGCGRRVGDSLFASSESAALGVARTAGRSIGAALDRAVAHASGRSDSRCSRGRGRAGRNRASPRFPRTPLEQRGCSMGPGVGCRSALALDRGRARPAAPVSDASATIRRAAGAVRKRLRPVVPQWQSCQPGDLRLAPRVHFAARAF